jgi:hypothetical protein
LEDVPVYAVGGEEVGEELGDDAEPVGFVAVDGFVVGCKGVFEEVGP